jgi:AraC-like DNA-binding protein
MIGKPREQAKFWRAEEFDNLGLLHATYITHAFDKHYHEEYVIAVVTRSEYSFFCEGHTCIARKGQIILINPGDIHSGYAINDEGWTYRALYPTITTLRQIASEMTGTHGDTPYFPDPVVDDTHAAGLLVKLHQVLEHSISQLERDTHLHTALGALIARHAHNRPRSLLRLADERASVGRTRHYLEAHYMENPSLEELAHIAGLSPYHLVRVFRQETGLPPHAYLTQVRIQRAKAHLQAGEPIAAVAAATGFSDQSHFTRRFKRIIGVTPGQFVMNV